MDRRDLLAKIVFAALLLLVTYLTVTPSTGDPGFLGRLLRWISAALLGDDRFGDKIGHFLAYAALGAAAFCARLPPSRRMVWAPLGLTLYGAFLEGAQALSGARDADVADGAVNAAGALVGVALAQFFARAFRPAAR